jgi:exopolysaccharide biosynthesis polyprenyl glycosylphosphotransferase
LQQVEVREDAALAWPVARPTGVWRLYLRGGDRRALVAAGDLVCLTLALLVALSTLNPGAGVASLWREPAWLGSLALLWLVLAPGFDAYAVERLGQPVSSGLAALQAGLATVGAYFLTPYVSAPLLSSRAVMLVFAGSVVLLMVGWRLAAAVALRRFVAPRTVLVVGTGLGARTIAEAVAGAGGDFRLAGFIDDGRETADAADDPTVLGGRKDLGRLVQSGEVTDVVVAEPSRVHADLLKAVVRAYESGVYVHPMAGLYEQLTGRIPVEHVGDDWIGAMPQIERLRGLGWVGKRIVDVVGAVVGLAILAAIGPFVAAAIKLDSPGPVLYAQERVGYRGRKFWVWKFRSMVADAEADGRPRWASPDDPRVTRVGRFLRSTRLDELPQMLNVLRGEMSVVGPRPERPEFVAELERQIPFYRARLLAKPGLTGWAQIKFRYGGSPRDALVKLQYDLYYVKHRSLMLDVFIMARTVPVVLRMRGT